ncbi:MAG: hypothetical protein AAF639_02100 [Chloroflexota bacterium]
MVRLRSGIRPHHTSQKQVHHWQRLLLWFYAGLFAFVLPFVCWGAAGHPGHPHTQPHLIFDEPVSLGPNEPVADVASVNIARLHYHSGPNVRPHSHVYPNRLLHPAIGTKLSYHTWDQSSSRYQVAVEEKTMEPVIHIDSRSIPNVLSSIYTLLCLLLGAWVIFAARTRFFSGKQATHFPQQRFLAVPVPPPQHPFA